LIVYATIWLVKREPVIFQRESESGRGHRESVTGGHEFIRRPRRRIRPKLCVGQSNRRNRRLGEVDVSLREIEEDCETGDGI
jgi:hypothetical protein